MNSKSKIGVRRGRPRHDPGIGPWRGDTLRVLRIVRGLSAEDLGGEVGVSKTTVLRWEHHDDASRGEVANSNRPTKDQLRKLATLFGVTQQTFSRGVRVVPE